MSSVFDFDSYKSYLSQTCKERALPLAKVAEAASIHRQYLNQVLNGKSHLSDDQAVLVGQFLGLHDEELEFFLLLVQLTKSSNSASQSYFAYRCKSLQKKYRDLSANLSKQTKVVRQEIDGELSEYFLDPRLQVCHTHLFIPVYQSSPKALMAKLGLTESELQHLVQRLLKLNLVENSDGKIKAKAPFLHLEKESLLSQQNHRNWRIYAANDLMRQYKEGSFFFSSTICSEARVRLSFIKKLQALIQEFHQGLPRSADEEVFQINMDVFAI